jgi:TPR repeat protein
MTILDNALEDTPPRIERIASGGVGSGPRKTIQAGNISLRGKMTVIDRYLRADGTVRDYRRAFPILLQLAEDGNASDQNLVGYRFGTGPGVRRNNSKAAAWYQRAVAGGSIEAIGNLALMCEKGRGVSRDLKRAFRLYAKGASLGARGARRI